MYFIHHALLGACNNCIFTKNGDVLKYLLIAQFYKHCLCFPSSVSVSALFYLNSSPLYIFLTSKKSNSFFKSGNSPLSSAVSNVMVCFSSFDLQNVISWHNQTQFVLQFLKCLIFTHLKLTSDTKIFHENCDSSNNIREILNMRLEL